MLNDTADGLAEPARGTGHAEFADTRRPRSVYGVGTEPDPRFTLANERTYLAWVRTSVACMAGGIAFDAFVVSAPDALRSTAGIGLVLIGIFCVVSGYRRWMLNERALRLSRPLTASILASILGLAFVAAGLVLVVAIALWGAP